MVPAPDAGQRELRKRPATAVHERQPVPPDRAPLYPDLPSNRLHEISVRVREVCDKYDLPYTTGSFLLQYGKAWRTIAKLSLPNKYLRDTADDAPGDPQRADVRRAGTRLRRYRSGHRSPSRAEVGDRHGSAVAPRQTRRQARGPGGLAPVLPASDRVCSATRRRGACICGRSRRDRACASARDVVELVRIRARPPRLALVQ